MIGYQFTRRSTAEALYWALQDDAYYQAMERSASDDPAAAKEAMLRYFDYSMMEGRRYGELVLLDDEAIGASVWTKPVDEALADQISLEKKTFLLQDMGPASLRTYQQIAVSMAARTKAVVPENCWYLSILGLAPEHQGKGWGRKFMEPVLEKVDALNVPTYLETFTPRNISFYKHLGYQEVVSFVEPVTAASYWVLLREANQKDVSNF
jgi:GNAT superfamily N-acetyltransferase